MKKETFALMREDALYKFSQREIIKEDDLVEALENKVIAGAGLDVFEFEPKLVSN